MTTLVKKLLGSFVPLTLVANIFAFPATGQEFKSTDFCELKFDSVEKETGGRVENFTVNIWTEREKRNNITAQEVIEDSEVLIVKRSQFGLVIWVKTFRIIPNKSQAVCLAKTLLLKEEGLVFNSVRYKVEFRWNGRV